MLANVLLLGATGFLGRRVTDLILDEGHNLRVLVRDAGRAAAFQSRGVDVMVGSALDPGALLAACSGADHVVSLVAVRRNRPQSFIEVNVDHPRLLGEAAIKAGIHSIVYTSAIGSSIDPNLRYLTSRYMGEDQLSQSGVAVCVLRFSLVIGEDGGVLDDFDRASKTWPVIVVPGSGNTRFQPILRDDAARCITEAITRPDLLDQALDLGGPEILNYNSLFELYCQARNVRQPRIHVPVRMLMPAAAVMEFLFKDPLVTPDELSGLQKDNLAESLDSVHKYFGWDAGTVSDWILQRWRRPA